MREIEVKARVSSFDSMKEKIDHVLGSEGIRIEKDDRYFKFPADAVQRVRIRRFSDHLEMTSKKTGEKDGLEDNEEYEISYSISDYEESVKLLKNLGLEDFFTKHKEGYEWHKDGIHFELFNVNDIGSFLELEAILPFDSDEKANEEERSRILSYISIFGLGKEDIETRSYREMILSREGRMTTSIDAYTDGGCSGNPGPGGWAFVVVSNGVELTHSSGGMKYTTNNQMELTAVINLLRYLKENRINKARIHTDSQYVKNGITNWIFSWKKNGWRTSDGKSVKNRELWETLSSLSSSLDVSWVWVKGHAGDEFNELCDSLCRKEMEVLR